MPREGKVDKSRDFYTDDYVPPTEPPEQKPEGVDLAVLDFDGMATGMGGGDLWGTLFWSRNDGAECCRSIIDEGSDRETTINNLIAFFGSHAKKEYMVQKNCLSLLYALVKKGTLVHFCTANELLYVEAMIRFSCRSHFPQVADQLEKIIFSHIKLNQKLKTVSSSGHVIQVVFRKEDTQRELLKAITENLFQQQEATGETRIRHALIMDDEERNISMLLKPLQAMQLQEGGKSLLTGEVHSLTAPAGGFFEPPGVKPQRVSVLFDWLYDLFELNKHADPMDLLPLPIFNARPPTPPPAPIAEDKKSEPDTPTDLYAKSRPVAFFSGTAAAGFAGAAGAHKVMAGAFNAANLSLLGVGVLCSLVFIAAMLRMGYVHRKHKDDENAQLLPMTTPRQFINWTTGVTTMAGAGALSVGVTAWCMQDPGWAAYTFTSIGGAAMFLVALKLMVDLYREHAEKAQVHAEPPASDAAPV